MALSVKCLLIILSSLSLAAFSAEEGLNLNNSTATYKAIQQTSVKLTTEIAANKSNKNNNVKLPVTKTTQKGTIKVDVVTNKPTTLVKPTGNAKVNIEKATKKSRQNSSTLTSVKMINKEKNVATTPIPDKTKENEIATKNSNKSEIIKKEQDDSRGSVNLNFDITCTCDLQRYVCDINCCCDPDCKESDKKIFEFCEIDKNRYYDDSFCDYARHIYINNTPYQWEVNQGGIFCVIKSNQPKSYVLQKKQPLKSFESAEKTKHGKQFWNTYAPVIESYDEFTPITYGSHVWIMEKDDVQRKLAIPKSYLTSSCIFKEDILYLKEAKSTCSQINIDEQNSYLNFASYTSDKKVILKPQYLLNITNGPKFNHSLYQACPKNVCLSMDTYVCDSSFFNCKNYNSNSSNHSYSFNIRNNVITCFNAVKKLQYNFIHNGTIGLVRVEVRAVLQNFQFEKESFEFEQEFSVNFKWMNQRENASDILSGNPGYLIGKPIVMGVLVIIGNSSVIIRNSTKFVNNFLTLPTVKNGLCIFNEADYTPIEFGYNVISKCQLKQEIIVIKNKTLLSANESCQIIQIKILETLNISTNKTLVVGLFGNAHPFDKKAWNEVFFDVSPLTFVGRKTGYFSNKNTTLNCVGISTLLSIDVLYSRVDFEDLLNQNKILALEYKFQNLRNLTFDVKNNLTIDPDLTIHSEVAFFDVTAIKIRKFVEAPSLKIKLPYDFFYPFIKIDNSCHSFKSNSVLVQFFILVFLIIYK